ncbi:RNA polymerase sigma factor [Winogradskyella sp.]|uniref:RNA polymerase sigma factor n=1 Tax=Winogradskyella sp. TaxID=1883156 RepID=UPI003BAD28A6
MKDLTDEQLMVLINNGDLQRMHDLFERYNIRIYNFCLKLTRNKTVSEDLTQETFYKVIKHRKSFNKKSFAAWIFTIARNLCNDHFKKVKLSPLDMYAIEANFDNKGHSDEEKKENMDHLKSVLNKLSNVDKQLIVLSRFERLKYREIADIMKMSESAIKTRIHRALHQLRLHYFKSSENA